MTTSATARPLCSHAALNILDGTVIGRCIRRHRHQEFLRFLNAVERAVPAGKVIHAIVNNVRRRILTRNRSRQGLDADVGGFMIAPPSPGNGSDLASDGELLMALVSISSGSG
jgi:hypothetical protein